MSGFQDGRGLGALFDAKEAVLVEDECARDMLAAAIHLPAHVQRKLVVAGDVDDDDPACSRVQGGKTAYRVVQPWKRADRSSR